METYLQYITKSLQLDSNGIWHGPNGKKEIDVSYPKEDYSRNFLVEDQSFWFLHRNRIITSVVNRFPPSGPILDVGGANGFVSYGLEKSGFSSILVEPGMDACINASSRGLSSIVRGTFEELQLERSSVYAVGLFDVLEHIESPMDFLSNIQPFLKRGAGSGRVYITVPAHRWLWSNYDDSAGHFTRYTLPGLANILGKSGYKLEYSTFFFSFLSFPIFFTRTIPYCLGLIKRQGNSSKGKISAIKKRHRERKGLQNWLMKSSFERELKCIKSGRVTHGASIMAVCSPS